MPMKQPHTDYGTKGETGERIPKKATSSDTSGERRTKVPRQDQEKYTPGETGERVPKRTDEADRSGERKISITGGVGMGKADALTGRDGSHMGKHDGNVGEHNTGTHGEEHFYKHQKHEYHSDGDHYRYGESKHEMSQPGTEKMPVRKDEEY